MVKFLEVQRISLTPISPIHIGCGQDFEPVAYVMSDGFLMEFDASLAPLSDADRSALRAAVGKGGAEAVLRVQRFFHERRDMFAGVARQAVAVAPGVEKQYLDRVGQVAQFEANGNKVINQLAIERTAHHPHSGEPLLPGSSLKGAMRTGWLDSIFSRGQRDEKSPAMEKRLLDGCFQTDPFRLVRIADAAGNAGSKVWFATNHKKQVVIDRRTGQERSAKGPSTRREAIVGGQYRAFVSEIRFDTLGGMSSPGKTPQPSNRISGFAQLANAVNAHYLPVLLAELNILEQRGLCDPGWAKRLRQLVGTLESSLAHGAAMVLRVGRHSGAEAVTLPQVRRIRIMQARGQPSTESAEGATTIWLAADNERNASGMLPFGWLIVEPEDAGGNEALKAWCAQEPKPDFLAARARLDSARAQAQALAERLAGEAAERAHRVASEAAARAESEARLATLGPNGRLIETHRARLETHGGRRQPVSGQLYQEARKLLLDAQTSQWTTVDRTALAELLQAVLPEKVDLGGKAKEIRAAVAKLREPSE